MELSNSVIKRVYNSLAKFADGATCETIELNTGLHVHTIRLALSALARMELVYMTRERRLNTGGRRWLRVFRLVKDQKLCDLNERLLEFLMKNDTAFTILALALAVGARQPEIRRSLNSLIERELVDYRTAADGKKVFFWTGVSPHETAQEIASFTN